MGCCFSTPNNQNQSHNSQTTQKNQHHEPPPPQPPPPPPPPPPFEEESVKEVLSETPIANPPKVPILTPETNTLLPLLQNPLPVFETKPPIEELSEPVSHLSETCSMSESFSAATTTTATITTITTTTVTEVREEDEATSKVHKWDRSPSRKRPHAPEVNLAGGRDRRLKSPATRSEPSPEKKIKGGSRPLRGREPRESVTAANRRRNAGAAAIRRDSGEGSGRRSRSPGRAMTGKVSAGGSRKEVPPPSIEEKKEIVPVFAVGKEKEKEKEKENKSEIEEVGEKNDVASPEECLENPHVSMECFIFL